MMDIFIYWGGWRFHAIARTSTGTLKKN